MLSASEEDWICSRDDTSGDRLRCLYKHEDGSPWYDFKLEGTVRTHTQEALPFLPVARPVRCLRAQRMPALLPYPPLPPACGAAAQLVPQVLASRGGADAAFATVQLSSLYQVDSDLTAVMSVAREFDLISTWNKRARPSLSTLCRSCAPTHGAWRHASHASLPGQSAA